MHSQCLVFLAFVLGAVAQSPSGIPQTCTPACPTADNSGFALYLVSSGAASSGLICSYPAVTPTDGESDTDFTCTYSLTTGALTSENDAGLCPGTTAACSTVTRRREDNMSAVLKRKSEQRIAVGSKRKRSGLSMY